MACAPVVRTANAALRSHSNNAVLSSCAARDETVGDVDLGARKRHADALVGWQADIMDNDPQPAPVSCRNRMRQKRDSGEDQPHGSRETGDFVQEEPFPKRCSLPD